MTKKTTLALVTAIAAFSFGTAYAGGDKADKSNTGSVTAPADLANQKPISKEEALKNGMPETTFKKADTNGDGYLDEQEIKAFNAQTGKKQ